MPLLRIAAGLDDAPGDGRQIVLLHAECFAE